MFVTTTLLSTGVFIRGEAQSAGNDGFGLPDPMYGGSGQPCRTGYPIEYECDPGLECVIHDHHSSFTTGTCQPPSPLQPPVEPTLGGLNDPCRSDYGYECNQGLVCQYELVDNEVQGTCVRGPPQPPQSTGGLDEPCNQGPGPACNSPDLMPNVSPDFSSWPGCVCQYRLMGSQNSESLGSGVPGAKPNMGGEGEACRNVIGDECDYGLYCQLTWDSSTSYLMGKCQSNGATTGGANELCNRTGDKCNSPNLMAMEMPNMPSIPGLASPNGSGCICIRRPTLGAHGSNKLGQEAPVMGELGKPCRSEWANECNEGLHCKYTWHGKYVTGQCKKDKPKTGGDSEMCNKAPLAPCNDETLVPEYFEMLPSGHACICKHDKPKTGGLDETCNAAPLSPCNDENLAAEYKALLPQGEVCTCRQASPKAGEKGGPCRKAMTGSKTPYRPCDDNLMAKYTKLLPSGESCTCEPRLLGEGEGSNQVLGMPAPMMGDLNQPCRNTPGDECNAGLYCKYSTDGRSISGHCVNNGGSHTTHYRGYEGEPCNLVHSGLPLCFDGLMCRNVPLGNGQQQQVCTRHDKAFEGEKCGVYADNGHPAQCENGLKCTTRRNYPSGETATCERPSRRNRAAEGERCGRSAYRGKPRQCESGLTCKTRKLLGVQNAGYMSTCERSRLY